MKGQLLAQHFAINSGAKYKYNVSSTSLSLDDSPTCVRDALDLYVASLSDSAADKKDHNDSERYPERAGPF